MKKRSIYQQQSQELMRIFEEAASSKKVLVVAMDYAKLGFSKSDCILSIQIT